MKQVLTVVAVMLLLAMPCRAAGEPEQVEGLDELWQAAESYGVEPDGDLSGGLSGLAEQALGQAGELLRRSAQTGLKLLAVAVFCGLGGGGGGGGGGVAGGGPAGTRAGGLQAVQMAGALAVTALSVSDMQTMIGLGRQTIEQMDGFAGLLLPVVAVLTAATGAATGAAVRQGATVLFSDLLIGAIDTLLVPIVYAYVAVCAAHAAVGNEGLKKLASVLKWVVTSLLTAVLLAFVGYLTASGAIAGSADAAAIKTAKMAISRAVPVVGGILADAAETVLVGAGVLRGTVGIVGMLGVLAICLIPFLQLAFHYLTYKLAAALIGTVSDKRLSDLLDSIGGAFGIVLGMTGACALMLLVSLASAVKAVTP